MMQSHARHNTLPRVLLDVGWKELVLGSPTSQGMLQDGRAAAPSKRFRVSKTEP